MESTPHRNGLDASCALSRPRNSNLAHTPEARQVSTVFAEHDPPTEGLFGYLSKATTPLRSAAQGLFQVWGRQEGPANSVGPSSLQDGAKGKEGAPTHLRDNGGYFKFVKHSEIPDAEDGNNRTRHSSHGPLRSDSVAGVTDAPGIAALEANPAESVEMPAQGSLAPTRVSVQKDEHESQALGGRSTRLDSQGPAFATPTFGFANSYNSHREPSVTPLCAVATPASSAPAPSASFRQERGVWAAATADRSTRGTTGDTPFAHIRTLYHSIPQATHQAAPASTRPHVGTKSGSHSTHHEVRPAPPKPVRERRLTAPQPLAFGPSEPRPPTAPATPVTQGEDPVTAWVPLQSRLLSQRRRARVKIAESIKYTQPSPAPPRGPSKRPRSYDTPSTPEGQRMAAAEQGLVRAAPRRRLDSDPVVTYPTATAQRIISALKEVATRRKAPTAPVPSLKNVALPAAPFPRDFLLTPGSSSAPASAPSNTLQITGVPSSDAPASTEAVANVSRFTFSSTQTPEASRLERLAQSHDVPASGSFSFSDPEPFPEKPAAPKLSTARVVAIEQPAAVPASKPLVISSEPELSPSPNKAVFGKGPILPLPEALTRRPNASAQTRPRSGNAPLKPHSASHDEPLRAAAPSASQAAKVAPAMSTNPTLLFKQFQAQDDSPVKPPKSDGHPSTNGADTSPALPKPVVAVSGTDSVSKAIAPPAAAQAALGKRKNGADEDEPLAKKKAPAPVVNGWGDAFLSKNKASSEAAQAAIAEEVAKASGAGTVSLESLKSPPRTKTSTSGNGFIFGTVADGPTTATKETSFFSNLQSSQPTSSQPAKLVFGAPSAAASEPQAASKPSASNESTKSAPASGSLFSAPPVSSGAGPAQSQDPAASAAPPVASAAAQLLAATFPAPAAETTAPTAQTFKFGAPAPLLFGASQAPSTSASASTVADAPAATETPALSIFGTAKPSPTLSGPATGNLFASTAAAQPFGTSQASAPTSAASEPPKTAAFMFGAPAADTIATPPAATPPSATPPAANPSAANAPVQGSVFGQVQAPSTMQTSSLLSPTPFGSPAPGNNPFGAPSLPAANSSALFNFGAAPTVAGASGGFTFGGGQNTVTAPVSVPNPFSQPAAPAPNGFPQPVTAANPYGQSAGSAPSSLFGQAAPGPFAGGFSSQATPGVNGNGMMPAPAAAPAQIFGGAGAFTMGSPAATERPSSGVRRYGVRRGLAGKKAKR